MSVLCRLIGHRWIPCEIRIEQSTTLVTARTLSNDPIEVPVTWVTDEVCARCGMESRWPV